jgi:hydrogenase nickel incorporation protein HypA/HybF
LLHRVLRHGCRGAEHDPGAELDEPSVHRKRFPRLWWGHPGRNGATVHEMAITQSVVDSVCEHAAGRRVHSVKLEVGALCAVVPDSMQFCFELATAGTVADGARLDVNVQPGAARCRTCGQTFVLPDLILLCPCGSADVEVVAGRDLKILSMEVS